MRFPPIPWTLRPEAVGIRRQDGEGGHGEAVTVRRCRVDRAGSLAPRDWQLTQGRTASVLIDATEYAGELDEGDLIVFDGADHAASRVVRVDNPDGTCHHWEVDAS